MKINLLKGIDTIDFKISKSELAKKLNQDLEFEIIEEDEEYKTEVLYLPEYSSSLYFEGLESDMNLAACETQNKDAELFNTKIFNKNADAIIALMKENGYSEIEEEIEEWGEKRIGFNDGRIDFFFKDDKLQGVSWGLN